MARRRRHVPASGSARPVRSEVEAEAEVEIEVEVEVERR
jgi:hypothetical protein